MTVPLTPPVTSCVLCDGRGLVTAHPPFAETRTVIACPLCDGRGATIQETR